MPLYNIQYRGTLHGSETFAYSCAVTGSGTLSDAATAAADALTAQFAASGFDDRFDDGIVWVDALVSEIDATGGPVIDSQIITAAAVGGSTGGSSPNQCSICVSKLTGLSGSRNRGRMYLPPPATGSLTAAGRLTSAAMTGLNAGITAWKNSLIGDGFTPQLVSVSQASTATISAFRVGDVVDTMQSRRDDLAEVYEVIPV